jgi:hypothetical protein
MGGIIRDEERMQRENHRRDELRRERNRRFRQSTFAAAARDHFMDESYERPRSRWVSVLDEPGTLMVSMLGSDTSAARLFERNKLTVSAPNKRALRGLLVDRYEGSLHDECTKIWCPISGMYLPSRQVAAAHIVPQILHKTPHLVRRVFGIRTNDVDGFLMHYRNGLLMTRELKDAFDAGYFILVQTTYFGAGHTPEFRVHVMRESILDNTAIEGSAYRPKLTFRELDGRVLNFPVGCARRPSTRCLFFRMIWSILMAKADGELSLERQVRAVSNDWPAKYQLKYLVEPLITPLWETTLKLKIPKFIADCLFERGQVLTEAETALTTLDLMHCLDTDVRKSRRTTQGKDSDESDDSESEEGGEYYYDGEFYTEEEWYAGGEYHLKGGYCGGDGEHPKDAEEDSDSDSAQPVIYTPPPTAASSVASKESSKTAAEAVPDSSSDSSSGESESKVKVEYDSELQATSKKRPEDESEDEREDGSECDDSDSEDDHEDEPEDELEDGSDDE